MQVQGIGWLVVRVLDLEKQLAFYRDVLGLPVVRQRDGAFGPFAMLDLGNGNLLELSTTGQAAAAIADRRQQRVTAVLRIYDFEGAVATLEAAGVVWLERLVEIPGGRLAWFLDPEGNVLAIQERAAESERPEDALARGRWTGGPPGVRPPD